MDWGWSAKSIRFVRAPTAGDMQDTIIRVDLIQCVTPVEDRVCSVTFEGEGGYVNVALPVEEFWKLLAECEN
jgi:hypothetical protein